MQTHIEGLIPPIATPTRDSKVDVRRLERLIGYLAPYIAGSVGENPSPTLSERGLIAEMVAGGSGPSTCSR